MRYQILQKPDFAAIRVHFDQGGEQLVCESAAMLARDSAIDMKTQMQGGLSLPPSASCSAAKASSPTPSPRASPGRRCGSRLVPKAISEVLEMNGQYPVFLSSGAFLAAPPSVQIDTKWQGARGFFSGAGLFLLQASGYGPLFFSAYGGIHAVDVGPYGYTCDTGHVVGFTGGLNYTVNKVGGLKSLFFSGEGLVCTFTGQGRLWISTRNSSSLVNFLHPFRPVKSNG